ncbi:LysR family transcriptional regulator [Gluconacetobacter liquefaciens NRIC 0522]|uniref:LysR family transcriptional regulator n=3 Tax=Gluconacetobacter liquefaciens TaxID=89584 RepID=A0A370G115_GLULI|nr:LysR family transcriptional regulator [Gluconacetobacter liquefaciens]MBB2187993.1 LysR family transcriptional regulator [Gluconacetobacter liquefaciens]RDI36294.1 LysR family transcriptional regulator [Gluconacetobacter liquefaciens]GBR00425.1 LysR family transcriptional regulator [Gluconacetobacter liquefaciens NRIC 0522]
MDRIDTMRVFTRVVERSSFIRAAEDLGLPPSTVTDAIKALEARLKVRLLHRTTRQVRATLDGEAYYRRCLAILDDIEDAESAFSAPHPRGSLRVDVLGAQARRIIVPGLPHFFADYPDITLHLSETDRFIDLISEGVDCALRVGAPKDSTLIARRIALLPEVTVASPTYLHRFGTPQRWDRLDGHRMVGFHSSATGGVLPLEFMVAGTLRTVMLPSTLTVNGADTYKEAASQGLGLIQVPRYAVQQELAAGTLVDCLPDTPPSASPVHVLYPRNRQLTLRVRVFIDWVARQYARHV